MKTLKPLKSFLPELRREIVRCENLSVEILEHDGLLVTTKSLFFWYTTIRRINEPRGEAAAKKPGCDGARDMPELPIDVYFRAKAVAIETAHFEDGKLKEEVRIVKHRGIRRTTLTIQRSPPSNLAQKTIAMSD